MKKYLLLGIISLVGIFNFSSANSFEMVCTDENGCTPGTLSLNAGDTLIGYSDTELGCAIKAYPSYEFHFENYSCSSLWINSNGFYCDGWDTRIDGSLTLLDSESLSFGNYECSGPNTITISYSSSSNSGGAGENIVQGGISAFSGIIDKLGGILGEFGPYIIYIAIACLGISLLFKALKNLLGFTSGNAKNSIGGREGIRQQKRIKNGGYEGMRNRRTRRRKNRRLGRYINKYEGGNKNLKFGTRGYNNWRN